MAQNLHLIPRNCNICTNNHEYSDICEESVLRSIVEKSIARIPLDARQHGLSAGTAAGIRDFVSKSTERLDMLAFIVMAHTATLYFIFGQVIKIINYSKFLIAILHCCMVFY